MAWYDASMKLRHAAAVALVGWYLLVPPLAINERFPPVFHFEQPISRWTVRGTYKSERRCRSALRRLPAKLKRLLEVKRPKDDMYDFGYLPPEYLDDTVDKLSGHAVCVPSTDPRLGNRPPVPWTGQ